MGTGATESPYVDTASTNDGHHFTAFEPPENDLSLVNHPMHSSTQFKFDLALQNGPESFQTFEPATGLASPLVGHDDSGLQSNIQVIPLPIFSEAASNYSLHLAFPRH